MSKIKSRQANEFWQQKVYPAHKIKRVLKDPLNAFYFMCWVLNVVAKFFPTAVSKIWTNIGMHNWNHDLVQQLSEDLDSLWRYEDYLKNSQGCDHCSSMWRKFKEMDEEKVEMLRHEIERHVNEKRFD